MFRKLWADKDERNLIVNVLFAFLIKGASLLVSLCSMPLYIRYFHDNNVLGTWYTILSMLSWITVCDLGLGNGLRNRLTEALAKRDGILAKQYVSSTYVVLIIIILPVIFLGSILLTFFDLNSFFGISTKLISSDKLQLSIGILFCGVSINFVLKTINSVFYAIQKSSVNNFLSLIVSVIPLCYIAFFDGGTLEENLISLSVVHVIAINLPLMIASVALFRTKFFSPYTPKITCFNFETAKKTLNFGMKFFLAQIFLLLLLSTNEMFITQLFSSTEVVEYSIYYRLFTVVGSLFSLALTPLWSKVTRDLAEHKYKKIRKTNYFLYMIAAVAIVAEFAIVPCLQWIVDIWLREETITINYSTAMWFALFGGLYILNIVLTTIANGMGELKTQIVFYGLGAILKLPITTLVKPFVNDWVIIIAYNCIVLMAFCVYQIFWVEKKIKKLSNQEE